MTTNKSGNCDLTQAPQLNPEPFLSIRAAAVVLGVYVWALRRAIKAGRIPAYSPFNGRKLVRLSEVVAAINASKIGGSK